MNFTVMEIVDFIIKCLGALVVIGIVLVVLGLLGGLVVAFAPVFLGIALFMFFLWLFT